MLEYLASGVIGSLIGATATYVIAKRLLSFDRIMDIFEEVLTEVTTDVETQKKVYVVGGILGQGIKSGLGMTGKRGKFKLEDVASEAIGGFIQNFFQRKQQSGQPQRLAPPNSPQDY